MTITIEEETAIPFAFDYKALAALVIERTLDQQAFPYEAEVCLTLTDNDGIRELNHIHRQIDRPTDVLSFPMLEYAQAGMFDQLEEDLDNFNPDTGEAMLGDIVISVEKVTAQAAGYGHSLEREFAFLIVHSMLHLFGYDHMTARDAAVMEQLQEQILEDLNILR